MSLDILKNDLKSGALKNIYFFYGDEEYLKSYYLKRLKSKLLKGEDEEFNLYIFEGKDLELNLLNDTLESYPLNSEKKLIIVNDLPIERIAGEGKNTKKGDFTELLENITNDFPPYSHLVINQVIETHEDNERTLLSSLSPFATLVKFVSPNESELVDWVSRHIAHHKHSCDNSTIKYFLSVAERDMTNLKNEIDKLCSFAVTTEITKKHIDEIVTKSLQAKVFDLSDALAKGDFSRAFKVLDILFSEKIQDILILAVLYKQFINLYRIKVCTDEGKQLPTIVKELGLKEYAVKINMSLCRNLSKEYLRSCFLLFEKADYELRSSYSQNKRAIIERLLGEMLCRVK